MWIWLEPWNTEPVIGSLRNHDEDDSHNVKKKKKELGQRKKQQLCTRITLLKYIIFFGV